MRSVGIDIGSSSIKVAELDAGSKSSRLVNFFEIPLKTEPGAEKQIEILYHLRQIQEQYQGREARFVVALPLDQVSVRQVKFPFRERNKILKSLLFELEDDIPFSHENAVGECRFIRYIGKTCEILAIVAPKSQVAFKINQVHESGIEPSVVSVDGLAYANLFEEWYQVPEESANAPELPGPSPADAILHIGHSNTLIHLVSRGRVIAARSISWGAQNLVDKLVEVYKLHPSEALTTLQNKGFVLVSEEGASKEQVAFSRTISSSLDQMAQELKLFILESQTDLNIEVKQIAFSGGLSPLKNLGPYLTQKTEVSANRLKGLPRSPRLDLDSFSHNELVSGVAIGLAIEGLKRGKIFPVNFRQKEFAIQNRTWQGMWETWGYAIKMATAAWLVLMVWSYLRDSWTLEMSDAAYSRLGEKANKFESLKARRGTVSVSRVESFIRQKKREADALEDLEKAQSIRSASEFLSAFSQNIPTSVAPVDVTRFKVEDEWVSVEGWIGNAYSSRLQTIVQGLAVDGKVQSTSKGGNPPPGQIGFNYRFKVARFR